MSDDNIIETTENGRYRVRLAIDEGTENPRRDYDHITHVITPTQQRYIDVDPDGGPLQYGWDYYSVRALDCVRKGAEDLFIRWAKIYYGAVVVEHRPVEGAWSFWYMTPEQIAEIGNTPAEAIAAEIQEYQAWGEGDVYGLIVERAIHWKRADDPDSDDSMTTWEEVASCWGLIGREYAEEEARQQLDTYKNEE